MKRIELDNFTHRKGKLSSRKGMGMELALLVLFVVFACSILLVSSALLGKSNLNDRRDEMTARFRLDQFAETALADGVQENESYKEVPTAEGMEITDAEGNLLLTVTWDADKKITGWVYH